MGFVVAASVGAGIYFLPAIEVAIHDTGQRIANAGSGPRSNAPFTMLLLGSDSDAKFKNTYLTQSMILARVDPTTKHVTMLSIPRDLWVQDCHGGYGKIDQAYENGGASCSIQTVEQDFHVHVDYYAWIGLQGLVTVIDSLGGEDVVASNPVMDDYYPADVGTDPSNAYAYQRILVLPGPQHMSGVTALQYVRARHDDVNGDFGRSIRQQQVLIALRSKAKQVSVSDIPNIASAMASYFQTSMSLTDMAGLLPVAGSIPLSSITQVVLLSPYTTGQWYGNQDALAPNWSLILPKVHQYFPAT